MPRSGFIILLIVVSVTLTFGHNVTPRPRPPHMCTYTFNVPQGAGGQCEGQEVEQALESLRSDSARLDAQVTSLLSQVAALMEDNTGLRERIRNIEGERPHPCRPGTPGCGTPGGPPSGVVASAYIRWGRTVCPANATAVYNGFAAGSHYSHAGGSSQYLCLPSTPQWDQFINGHQGAAYIYGAEYEINTPFDPFDKTNARNPTIHDQSPPCVLCHVTGKSIVMSFPAKKECPVGWHLEYKGYMMMSHHTHSGRTNPVCMDIAPEVLHGGQGNQDGALFYLIESVCGALPCPSYIEGRELVCVVCSI